MDDFVMSPELQKAMQETSVLYCETARNQQNKEQNNQQKRNTHSGDLRKQIGAHYFARLQQILKVGFNIPDTALNRLTPGEAIALIDNFGFPCRLISYENRLKKIAQSQNMSVTGFETEEEHRAIAKSSTTGKDQIQGLKSSIDNQPKEVALREKFTQLYLQQDITALYKMMSFARDGKRTNAGLKLLDVRNAKWVSTIDSATKEKPCFFAFGCAHLPGGNGVISKLLNLGFKITPIRQRIID